MISIKKNQSKRKDTDYKPMPFMLHPKRNQRALLMLGFLNVFPTLHEPYKTAARAEPIMTTLNSIARIPAASPSRPNLVNIPQDTSHKALIVA